jgi:hypothetical protein
MENVDRWRGRSWHNPPRATAKKCEVFLKDSQLHERGDCKASAGPTAYRRFDADEEGQRELLGAKRRF